MKFVRTTLALCAMAALCLGCKGSEEPAPPPEQKPARVALAPSPTATPAPTPTIVSRVGEVLDFGEGLTAKILADGEGEPVGAKDTARLQLLITDDLGNEKWSGEFTLRRGVGQGIAALDRGLEGMMRGERRLVQVPWRLGYGELGEPSVGVRAREDLHIEATLLDIERDTTKETPNAP